MLEYRFDDKMAGNKRKRVNEPQAAEEPQAEAKQAVVRHPAPDFSADGIVDGKEATIHLSDYRGKYVVLLFYPLDFTFVCPTEIIGFSDRIKEFRDINAEVIAVSVDSKFAHLAWVKTPRKEGGLGATNLPLVSDLKQSISRAYGVFDDELGHSLRATFIISDKGIVRHATINDPPVGRSVDETLRVIKAFQFNDQHGEVCPLNWTPGSATIKGHPEEKLEYFGKQFS